jgi:hypothetical protein
MLDKDIILEKCRVVFFEKHVDVTSEYNHTSVFQLHSN